MPFSVVMPALEMAQESGKLLAWRRKEGERVSKGEPLLEIETDKAVVEVEAPADGILAGIKAPEGADVPVGRTIAWIVAPGEAVPEGSESTPPAARAGSYAAAGQFHSSTLPSSLSTESRSSAKISPKARRLAKEMGIDITTIRGSGANGEILASDVLAAARPVSQTAPDEKDSGRIYALTTVGRIMAERTTQSWTTVPHFFVSRDIEASGLSKFRESSVTQFERSHPELTGSVRITHTDLLVALVGRVLLAHPRLNASWSAEGIRLHDHVNMGIAIAVDDGVVAAVIGNAHSTSLSEIAIRRAELTERARAGKLRPADIADATFTISNLGMYQVDEFTAIITPPQAAILAVGGIVERVVVVEGKPAVCLMMKLTLSCDHRVVDGARAASFLKDLANAAREPEKYVK